MKSDQEYREYLDRTIRVSDTVKSVPNIGADATDQPVPSEETGYRSEPVQSNAGSWFRENWLKILSSVIATCVLGLLAWYGSTLFNLNREIGIAATRSAALEREQTALGASIQRLDERIERELDTLTLRVDRILESRGSSAELGGGN
jgi:hypothetical protein